MKIGDYVFATWWSDGSPEDPWIVGFIDQILIDKRGTYYRVQGSKRYWRHANKISKKKGNKILEEFPQRSRFN